MSVLIVWNGDAVVILSVTLNVIYMVVVIAIRECTIALFMGVIHISPAPVILFVIPHVILNVIQYVTRISVSVMRVHIAVVVMGHILLDTLTEADTFLVLPLATECVAVLPMVKLLLHNYHK